MNSYMKRWPQNVALRLTYFMPWRLQVRITSEPESPASRKCQKRLWPSSEMTNGRKCEKSSPLALIHDVCVDLAGEDQDRLLNSSWVPAVTWGGIHHGGVIRRDAGVFGNVFHSKHEGPGVLSIARWGVSPSCVGLRGRPTRKVEAAALRDRE